MTQPQLPLIQKQVFWKYLALKCIYVSMLIILGMGLPCAGHAAEKQNTPQQPMTTTSPKRLVPDVWHAKLPVSSEFKLDIDDVIITHDDDVQIIYSNYNISPKNPDEEFYFSRVYSLKQQKIIEEWIVDEIGAKAKAGPLKEGPLSKGSSEDYRKTHAKRKIDYIDSYSEPFPLGDGTFLGKKNYEIKFFSCNNFNTYFERTDASGKVMGNGLMLVQLYEQPEITHPFCAFEAFEHTYTISVKGRSVGGSIFPLGDGTYLVPVGTEIIRFEGYMKSPYIEASNKLVLVSADRLHELYIEALIAWEQSVREKGTSTEVFIKYNTRALERAAEVGYLLAKDALRVKQESRQKNQQDSKKEE